ncbi:unnamed protein product [Nippostrongylus brasiliensis]|uniref:MH1 domain-containing protein n=1 Tax=Nippostrongylus brasiliensis TaxID=27835 RepID=A0A0N4XDQ4_NIPBR|nr:unnamed protein product [Nippostrongylus brasiliensis]
MRGFDAEDVEVIRKAVESGGVDAKACAPGPPMDERPDDDQPEEDSGLIPQIDRPMSMPYLCCKLWRWKDLQVLILTSSVGAKQDNSLISLNTDLRSIPDWVGSLAFIKDTIMGRLDAGRGSKDNDICED